MSSWPNWIRRETTNLEIEGSSPSEDAFWPTKISVLRVLQNRGHARIELATSPTLKENHTTRPLALVMENAGFDPAASSLRTTHSTD